MWVVGGWRLSLVRLVEEGGIPEVQAVCVVSKARKRARRGKSPRIITTPDPKLEKLDNEDLVQGP